jgi:hypothetical protein
MLSAPMLALLLALAFVNERAAAAARVPQDSHPGSLRRAAALSVDPGRVLGEAFVTTGAREWVVIPPTVFLRHRATNEPRLLKELVGLPDTWHAFLSEMTKPGSGVWIDAMAFTIPGAVREWELERIGISTTNEEVWKTSPRDFDTTRLIDWLMLVDAAVRETTPVDVLVTWKRSAGPDGRFEALTDRRETAERVHQSLSKRLEGAATRCLLVEETNRWRVVVDADLSSLPESRPTSRKSHRISVKVSGDGDEIASANELVSTVERVRAVAGTIGERLETVFEKVAWDRVSYAVRVAVAVDPSLPAALLAAWVSDLFADAYFFGMPGQHVFVTEVTMTLTIGETLKRLQIRPFKTLGWVRSERGEVARAVLLGLQVRPDATDGQRFVILGPAVSGWENGEQWLWTDRGRGGESAPTVTVGGGSAALSTARDVADALKALLLDDAGEVPLVSTRSLDKSYVVENDDSRVLVLARGAHAGRRGHVIDRDGVTYLASIEVAALPTVEKPELAACRIISRSKATESRPFAPNQLVIFEPQ